MSGTSVSSNTNATWAAIGPRMILNGDPALEISDVCGEMVPPCLVVSSDNWRNLGITDCDVQERSGHVLRLCGNEVIQRVR